MSSRQTSPRQRAPIVPIVLWALAALGVMALLTYGITSFLAWASGKTTFWGAHEHPQLTSLLRTATPAAALVAAGAAGAVGFLRQRSQEESHGLEMERHEAELVARLRERYSASAEQLGHDSVAVRLAGVYALAALADDWLARGDRSEAQVCIDLLCAYQRVPRPFDPTEQNNRAELEVRQTITRVITAHLQNPKDPNSWCGLDFDFTGAVFAGNHNFLGTQFTGGTMNFTGAQFTGGTMNFTDAQFTGGIVRFTDAQSTGGIVRFTDAQFTGGTIFFSDAQFTETSMHFFMAKFAGSGVDFTGAQFTDGTMDFRAAQFTKGALDFSCAEFTGSGVDFTRAKVTGGAMYFNDVDFTGSIVDFTYAQLTRGTLDFTNAEFLGSTLHSTQADITMDVPGPWGERSLPERYPSEATAVEDQKSTPVSK